MSNVPTLNIYFAGDPSTHKDMTSNALLAESIADISDHRYGCVLPQNFPIRDKSPKQVRDEKLLTLMECDLALFNFEGVEMDSSAVAEFMVAKFADIPTVILRTEKSGGEPSENSMPPWSLMTNFFPRTEVEVVNSEAIYQTVFEEFPMTDATDIYIEERSCDVARTLVRVVAQAVVDAFDRTLEMPPVLNDLEAQVVYPWLARFFGPDDDAKSMERLLMNALERKRERHLISSTSVSQSLKAHAQ
ncbi:MAG: hypothetical protein AAFX93_02155 [Verrucomicrobiota bacterium]